MCNDNHTEIFFFVTRVRRGGTSESEIMAQSPSQASQQVGFMAQQMRLRYGVHHSKTSRGFWGGTTAGGTYIQWVYMSFHRRAEPRVILLGAFWNKRSIRMQET